MDVSWNLAGYQQSRYKLPSCLRTFSSKRITYQTHHHSSNFSFSSDFVFSVTSLPSLCHLSSSIFFPSHQQSSCLPNLPPVRASRRVCPILCPPIHHHRPSERSRKVQNQSSWRELTAAPRQESPRRSPLPEPNPQVSTGISLQTINGLSLMALHNIQVLTHMPLVQRSKLRCHPPLLLLSPMVRMRVSTILT